jgi:predicted transcriptional regulator
MDSQSLHEFVARSNVRQVALEAAADGGTTTDELLETVDGSRSAVYKAVDALTDAGLVRQERGLTATGRGEVLAERLADRERVEGVLDDDYWATRDVNVLPRRFRRRLPCLAAAEVVAGTEIEPGRARREAESKLRSADRVDVFARVYDPAMAAVLDEVAEDVPARLVTDRAVESAGGEQAPAFEADVQRRVGDVPCSLGVTDECVLLNLPTLDGEFDPSTVLVADSGAAVEWGRDLFEAHWRRANEPAESADTGE